MSGWVLNKQLRTAVDEVNVLDTIFSDEKKKKLFTLETYHIVDYNQEWDKGCDNPYFPEFKTTIAKFFNTDFNTTNGFYKFEDVESGAMMTLHFKTMPFANNNTISQSHLCFMTCGLRSLMKASSSSTG
ncbi:unnamed protein product [Moneuplotes crassus]|uniref:Uncharacterized protein n=1 Tax=Euplotes crassus TaxID=5936 RepID=A0AAD1XVP8_EUPCR|nr:unnamed protein product [Moneuplotes crassus]